MISRLERDFKKTLAFFGLGLLFLIPFPRFCQADQVPVISGIEVWVDELPGSQEMVDLIPLRAGEPFTLKKVRDAIRLIWKTGLFQDIQVVQSGEAEVRLKFLLRRHLRVRRVRFQGDKSLATRKLGDSLSSFRVDNIFTQEKLDRALGELRRALEREGYFGVNIQPNVQRLPNGPEVDLTFTLHSGQKFSIGSIKFGGDVVIPEDEMRRIMKSRQGGAYIPSQIERDIDRLRNFLISRGYRRAEVELAEAQFEPEAKKVDLSLKITPHERIEVLITGADVPRELVEPIWEEKIFEEWGIRQGEARILSYLRGKGYIFAAISSSIKVSESEVQVIHEVSPGQKYRIQEVKFEGNSHFPSDQLKENLGIVERLLFLNFLDGQKVFALPEEIRSFYQSRGFPDVRVDLNFLQMGKKLTAVYHINEGEQKSIAEVVIRGAKLMEPAVLRGQIGLSEGSPYFDPAIQREIQKLETFYLNQGIRGTKVEANAEPVDKNSFRVIFDIQEGGFQRIKNILVVGNRVTKTHTILRELELKEGELARYDALLTSKQNLENLGIFSEVKLEEIPLSAEEQTLVITVREGERNYAGLGVGLETKNEPWRSALFDVALRLRGTAELMRSNIFGQAARLSFISQFSLAEKRAVVSWEQPYFLFDFPLDTYVNAWIEEEDRQSFGFDREGVSVSGIKPMLKDLTLLVALRYARTTLTYLEVTPSAIDRQFFPYSTTSISSSIIRERRNDPFNPQRGNFSSLAFEWAFPLFETESDFLKAILKHQFFSKVVPGVNLSTTFRFGLGMGRMPIHERFFAGGSNSFRGERFDELGPRDRSSGKPIGGKALFLLNLELTFPLLTTLENLTGAVFYDSGQVFYNRSDFDLRDLEHALGLGLRYRTPLGPLRLELGWNLSEPGRRGKPLIFITIGHVF